MENLDFLLETMCCQSTAIQLLPLYVLWILQ